MNCHFDEEVEIVNIVETQDRDCVQIIQNNYKKKILTIISWSFSNNC